MAANPAPKCANCHRVENSHCANCQCCNPEVSYHHDDDCPTLKRRRKRWQREAQR